MLKKMKSAAAYVLIFILTACHGNMPDSGVESPQPTASPTLSPTISPTISPTVSPTISPTVQPTTPPAAETVIDYVVLLYTPIINSYANLEQSGYTITEADLITDGLLNVQHGWGVSVTESLLNNKTWIPQKYGLDALPKLMYSLHSMDGFRPNRPEPIIGAESDGVIEIISIYVIELYSLGGEAESYGAGVRNVFGAAGRDYLSTTLTLSDDGLSIITTMLRGGEVGIYEYFQIVGAGIGVGWMEHILTVGAQRYSVCYIGPCEHCADGLISITEDEYIETVRRLGASGYNTAVTIEAGHVDLQWLPVYNN